MTTPELFDSEPYRVDPPPVKIRIELGMWSSRHEVTLKGTALELYNEWLEDQTHENECAFLDWVVDGLQDEIMGDISVEDWNEV
jgi:hypothetical protein